MGTFSLLILTFGLASGYNLNNNTLRLLPLMKNGTLGWSLVHQDQLLYVGAPQAGTGQSGEVYQCEDLTTTPTCSKLGIKPDHNLDGSWFGGSLAASKDTLYSCAFRYNMKKFDEGASIKNMKYRTGKCYKKGRTETSFEDLVDFTKVYEGRKKYKFPRDNKYDMCAVGDSNYKWWDYGVYGASSTILVTGKFSHLVIGNPLDLESRGAARSPSRIHVGSIGKIEEESRKTEMKRTYKKTPWLPPIKNDEDWTNSRFAGYTVTSGNFFWGDTGLAIGAPKINNYRGKVFICRNCFETSPTFRKIDGSKPGEHFGSSLAACDIDGDDRDDLIVGAPHYPESQQTYNSGLVYVIMATGEFPRDDFDLPYSITAKSEMRNARFGSSVACLGNTDGSQYKKVMVGAPYYEENGAVFVFRYKLETGKLELSQTIKSQGWEFLNKMIIIIKEQGAVRTLSKSVLS